MDLALYNTTTNTTSAHTITGFTTNKEMTSASPSSSKLSSRAEVIANKVLKYLMTGKGSDAFNPDYGSNTILRIGVSPRAIAEIRLSLQDDIRDCIYYLKTGETILDSDDERLSGIEILEIEYDASAPTELHVHIRVTTTSGNVCLLRMDI